MHWLRRNFLFGTGLFLALTLLTAEAWLWVDSRRQARRALAALERKKQERDWLAGQSPAPTEENGRAIARDLADTRQVLADLRTALRSPEAEPVFAAPPAGPVDLYGDIAAFVEKIRASARYGGVLVGPDERFGFSSHACEGPGADLVPAVFRQRVAGQCLLEALLGSHPRALLSVRRERPLTAAQRAPLASPGADILTVRHDPHPDFFDLDPLLSVRVPGRLDSDAFRLEFAGGTPALRAFLTALAAGRLPIVVRSVEVESPAPDASGPATEQNLLKFVVVAEYVLPVVSPEEPAS